MRSRTVAMLRRHWIVTATACLVIAVVGAIGTRLFVVPASDHPGPTSAFVVLNGNTYLARLYDGAELSARYPNSALAVSVPSQYVCPRQISPELVCFVPDPSTTQGEARAAAALAKQNGWTSITVVTTADQVWRAKLRFSRCYKGQLRVVQAPTSIADRLFSIPYEAAATVKAEVFQRGC